MVSILSSFSLWWTFHLNDSISWHWKKKCCQLSEIFITGCSRKWHFDNFWYSQLWKFPQNYDISVLVLVVFEKFSLLEVVIVTAWSSMEVSKAVRWQPLTLPERIRQSGWWSFHFNGTVMMLIHRFDSVVCSDYNINCTNEMNDSRCRHPLLLCTDFFKPIKFYF